MLKRDDHHVNFLLRDKGLVVLVAVSVSDTTDRGAHPCASNASEDSAIAFSLACSSQVSTHRSPEVSPK